MSRIMMALLSASGLVLAATAVQAAPSQQSTDTYNAARTSAEAQYKADKTACDSQKDNAKDICVAEAKGKENIAKADAKAVHENTPKTREAARVAHAQATYDVAKEKCDDLSGNAKDVCVKEAKAGLVRGKADAKVDRVAADTRNDGAAKRADARDDAAKDKRNADYKVAVEKCDVLAGGAKDACVGNAKVQYGKT
jgi:hypothetical protein